MTGFAALAALNKAKETGRGESIDVAQYEVMIRMLNSYPVEYLNLGMKYERAGNRNAKCVCFGLYKCMDGKCIYIAGIGAGISKKLCEFLGIEYGTELIPDGLPYYSPKSEGGQAMESALLKFLAEKTAAEAETELLGIGVPAQMVMDLEDAEVNPQYIARETFTQWEAVDGRKIKGVNIIPKFVKNPGMVWRGCPTKGMDTRETLEYLGYTEEDINSLYEKEVVS